MTLSASHPSLEPAPAPRSIFGDQPAGSPAAGFDAPQLQMDRKRPPSRRRLPTWVLLAAGLAAAAALTLGLSRLRAAVPKVERSSLWIDAARRGELVRQVKGPGNLVPEHIRFITAETAGRIEKLPLRPGAPVQAGTVLLELSNPDVQLQALEAERQLAAARAQLIELRTRLTGDGLTQEGSVAQLGADAADAARKAKADEALAADGTLSKVELQTARERAAQLQRRLTLESRRTALLTASQQEQLAAQAEQVARLAAVVRFRREQIASMVVRASEAGVLAELPLQLGQWATPGTLLAKVVQPEQLKAELRIPESQARDLLAGLPVNIDTRNGTVAGRVLRIAPSASQGSVLVEVELTGKLPKGARPDLSIDGTIELERVPQTLYVGRPAGAQPDSNSELFKLTSDGEAVRTKVRFGRASVSTIEVLDGLSQGDRVILSDTSSWETADRLRIQ